MREGREELNFQKSDSAEQRRNRALRFAILGVVLSFSTFLGLVHRGGVFRVRRNDTLAVFIATVGGTTVIGAYEWELKTLAETVQQRGGFDPGEIRGRDSFKEVSEASGVSKKSLMKQFDLSEEEFGKPIKDVAMEREYRFDTEDVRQFISEQLKE